MNRFIAPAVIAAVVTFYAPAKSADNDPPCLTREQAKERYPGQWLYWRTERKCWYGNGRMQHTVNRGLKTKRLPVIDASSNEVQHKIAAVTSPPAPSVYYPALMTGNGTTDGMLTPWPMAKWPLVTDFDVEPPVFLPWRRIDMLIK